MAAMDMVIKEFDKKAMCKRGSIATHCNDKWKLWGLCSRNEPVLPKAKREKMLKGLQEEVGKILVIAEVKHLTYLSGEKLITPESKREAIQFIQDATRHPQWQEWSDDMCLVRRMQGLTSQERTHREDYLDAELKEIKMGFITGVTPLTAFSEKLDEFEQTEY